MPFTIHYDDRVKLRDIPAIPEPCKSQVRRAIETRLSADHVGIGKPLQYVLKGSWRLRVGRWRILYRIKGDTVTVYAIDLRRDACDR